MNIEFNLTPPPVSEPEPPLLRVVAGTPFVVVYGQHMCLTRGFDKLDKKAGRVWKTVKSPVETFVRPMKLVSIAMYYPVLERYEDVGEYWADVKTGTLYRPFDGKCMSSDMLEMVLDGEKG